MHYIMFKPFLCLWEHGILCGALIIEKTGKKDKWMSEHCAWLDVFHYSNIVLSWLMAVPQLNQEEPKNRLTGEHLFQRDQRSRQLRALAYLN